MTSQFLRGFLCSAMSWSTSQRMSAVLQIIGRGLFSTSLVTFRAQTKSLLIEAVSVISLPSLWSSGSHDEEIWRALNALSDARDKVVCLGYTSPLKRTVTKVPGTDACTELVLHWHVVSRPQPLFQSLPARHGRVHGASAPLACRLQAIFRSSGMGGVS